MPNNVISLMQRMIFIALAQDESLAYLRQNFFDPVFNDSECCNRGFHLEYYSA
jgi:hypothetical protein